MHEENWPQYQRSVAADDTGWIYFGIGNTASQIIAFDPKTGKATAMIPEERAYGARAASIGTWTARSMARPLPARTGTSSTGGDARKIGGHESPGGTSPSSPSSQGLFHRQFPDGKRCKRCDLTERGHGGEGPEDRATRTAQLRLHQRRRPHHGRGRRPTAPSAAAPPSPCASSATTPKDEWIQPRRATASGTRSPARAIASSWAGTAAASCWNGTRPSPGCLRSRGRPAAIRSSSPRCEPDDPPAPRSAGPPGRQDHRPRRHAGIRLHRRRPAVLGPRDQAPASSSTTRTSCRSSPP